MSNSLFYASCYLGSLAISAAVTPLAIAQAKSYGLLDEPSIRKVHRSPIPRVGGVAIALATVVVLVIAMFQSSSELVKDEIRTRQVLTLLVGAISIAIVGFFDDIFEIRSKYKLLALLVAAVALCGAGGSIQSVTLNGIRWFDLGIAAWPVTVLWIVAVTVSINFIDGLDGLAGGIVVVACGVLAVGAGVGGDPTSVTIALALAGGICGFLIYNFHPAKVFMGDCGSMFIGFLIAGACVLATPRVGSTRGILLPSFALAVPLLDTLFTMLRRGILQRRSLFAAERGHVHHRLMDVGLGHFHVVLLLYGVTLFAGMVAITWVFSGYWITCMAVFALSCGLLGVFKIAGSMRARDTVKAIRRNRALGREIARYQHAFYDMQLRFREVRDFDAWWKQLCHAADVFDFAKIDLPVSRRDGSTTNYRWRRDQELVADNNSITAEVPIPQRRNGESLRASVEVTVVGFLESAGHRVALFSRLMSDFGLDQVERHGKSRNGARINNEELKIAAVGQQDEPASLPHLRVALVHDFLYTYAGAERVLEQLVEVYPQSDIFSLFDFLPEGSRGFIRNKPVQTSFLQRMPFAKKKHRAYLPLMPLAIEQLEMSGYDIVISSSYMAAKGVITRPDQLHVCYCHTPVRFAWDLQNQYLGQAGLHGIRSIVAKMILHYIRNWDVRSANGVDVFISNSEFVGRRIRKVYRRDSTTIYPPVDTEFFSLHEEKQDYYLTASRMVPYKRIDLVVEAFSHMPERKLVVIGDGPEMERIRAKAGTNVTILGHESAENLKRHMQRAKAFIFAAEEDFGIAPVEAQACGTPVIAFGRGGVTETVIEGETGVLFQEQTIASIQAAVEAFETKCWDSPAIRKHAEKFSARCFRDSVRNYVQEHWNIARQANSRMGESISANPELAMVQ